GGNSTCGVDSDHNTACWGDNTFGQLGLGGASEVNTPLYTQPGMKFIRVVPSWRRACGITTQQRSVCWGDNQNGAATGIAGTASMVLEATDTCFLDLG